MRSLNVAVCAGMMLGEALRCTGGFPHDDAAALTRGTKDGHFLEHPSHDITLMGETRGAGRERNDAGKKKMASRI